MNSIFKKSSALLIALGLMISTPVFSMQIKSKLDPKLQEAITEISTTLKNGPNIGKATWFGIIGTAAALTSLYGLYNGIRQTISGTNEKNEADASARKKGLILTTISALGLIGSIFGIKYAYAR